LHHSIKSGETNQQWDNPDHNGPPFAIDHYASLGHGSAKLYDRTLRSWQLYTLRRSKPDNAICSGDDVFWTDNEQPGK
jgi:hypothetical protein